MSTLAWLKLGLALAPQLRALVGELVSALKDKEDLDYRRAYEAMRRAAFIARNVR